MAVGWFLLATVTASGAVGQNATGGPPLPPRIVDVTPTGVLVQREGRYESHVVRGSTFVSAARLSSDGPYDVARCMDGCRGIVVSQRSGARIDADGAITFADRSGIKRRTVKGRSPGDGGKQEVLDAASADSVFAVHSDLVSTARLRAAGADVLDLEAVAPQVGSHRSADGSTLVVDWQESTLVGSPTSGLAVVRRGGDGWTVQRLSRPAATGRIGCVSSDGSAAIVERDDRHLDIVELASTAKAPDSIQAGFSSHPAVRDQCALSADAAVVAFSIGPARQIVVGAEPEATVAVLHYRRGIAEPVAGHRITTRRTALDPSGCCFAWLDGGGAHVRRWSTDEVASFPGDHADLAFLADGRLVLLDRTGTPRLVEP